MTTERRASDHGTAAWLRIALVALVITLLVPALALADDSGAAVLDPPAAMAADSGAAVLDPPAEEAAAPVEAGPEVTAPVQEPAPVDPPVEPVVTAAPPPAPVVIPPVVAPPVLDVPVDTPPAALPVSPPPAADLPPPVVPVAGAAAPAPDLIEIVPAAGSGTPVLSISNTQPGEPPASHTTIDLPAPVLTPPTPGVAAALGIPNTPPAVSIGPPQAPLGGLLAALGGASTPTATTGIADLVANLLDPGASTGALPGSATGGAAGANQAVVALAERGDEASFSLTAEMVTPVGPAPAGSSLLAVLAGYVLPGASGPPASTLVLFIVIGLILGVSYAARPQLSERLAPGNLLGASTGHRLAVRRPG